MFNIEGLEGGNKHPGLLTASKYLNIEGLEGGNKHLGLLKEREIKGNKMGEKKADKRKIKGHKRKRKGK